MGRKQLTQAEIDLAGAREDLRVAARDAVAWKLIIACLLRRLPARQAQITHAEVAAALSERDTAIERVTDNRTGDLLVRLSRADEDGPAPPASSPPAGKIINP